MSCECSVHYALEMSVLELLARLLCGLASSGCCVQPEQPVCGFAACLRELNPC